MKDLRERMENISDKFYEKTGCRMDVETSMNNLVAAFACESQRTNSAFPNIPVISHVEIKDKEVFDGKLDAFSTDFFFFLKEQEKDFDAVPYASSFYADDRADIEKMISEAYKDILLNNVELFADLLNNCADGDKIRVRRKINNPNVTGKVAIIENGEPVMKMTDEYVFVIELFPNNEREPFKIFDVYPV